MLFDDAGGGVAGLGAVVAFLLLSNDNDNFNDDSGNIHSSEHGTKKQCVPANLSYWWANTPGFIEGAWTFQRCTEILMEVEVGQNNSMFLHCDTSKNSQTLTTVPGNCWNGG